jgi:DNA polymerase-4
LLYVGSATTKKLAKYGIYTIGQLANTNIDYLRQWLHSWGAVIYRFANGWDNTPVACRGEESFIKSVGNSTTLPRDVNSLEDAKKVFYMLSESVASRLREHGLKARTVHIYVRDNELTSCDRQAGLRYPSFITGEIADKAFEIFCKKYVMRKPIRSLGVRGCNLVAKDMDVQLDLFDDYSRRERLEQLEYSVDNLRDRFGYHIVQRGIIFEDRKLTGLNPKDHTIHPVNFFDRPVTVDYQIKRPA